jgi:hypothetical protein
MRKINLRRVFHGSPTVIDEFNYRFTSQGTDALGSGFYFTTQIDDALNYAVIDKDRSFPPEIELNPTVHTVSLDIKNPMTSDLEMALTLEQVRMLIARAPIESMQSGLEAWPEMDYLPLEKVILIAAENLTGERNLMHTLFLISNDFYGDDTEAFVRAVHAVLHFDGLVHRATNDFHHVVAWFPEQITIVKRQSRDQVCALIEARQAQSLDDGKSL